MKQSGFVRDTKGSWPFWSPEMIDNHQSNVYSAYCADVWASGVCLWIFIYGTLPFWAPGPSHIPDPIFDSILTTKTSPPRFPSRRSPELCELLLDIFLVDPVKRPTFQDLSKYSWIQQHSEVATEIRLNALSSVSIDCSDLHLEIKTAVTPGEVNFLSENAKSHFVRMARRVKEKVRQRHRDLIAAKDEEIVTKIEEMKHFDPVAPPPSNSTSNSSPTKLGITIPPLPPPPDTPPQRPSSIRNLSQPSTSPTSKTTRPNSFRNTRTPSNGVDNTLDQPLPASIGRDISQNTNFTNQTDPSENHEKKPLNPIEKKDSSENHDFQDKIEKIPSDNKCCLIL